MYATYYSGGNIDVTAEQAEQLSDRDVWVLEYGSKWEFASFFTYTAIICAYITAWDQGYASGVFSKTFQT